MEILKDEALVLKKKNVNESNVVVVLYTKNYGKINAISYGVRASNKREKISLSPCSYISVELEKKIDGYVLKNHNLKKNFNGIYKDLGKMQIAFYMVYVLNQILEYHLIETEIYEKIYEIFVFLENHNKIKIDEEYIEKFLIRFLRRLMIELGVYKKEIEKEKSISKYEKYLNKYFSVDIDFQKIIIGR